MPDLIILQLSMYQSERGSNKTVSTSYYSES